MPKVLRFTWLSIQPLFSLRALGLTTTWNGLHSRFTLLYNDRVKGLKTDEFGLASPARTPATVLISSYPTTRYADVGVRGFVCVAYVSITTVTSFTHLMPHPPVVSKLSSPGLLPGCPPPYSGIHSIYYSPISHNTLEMQSCIQRTFLA